MKQGEGPTLRCNSSIIKWIVTFSLQIEKNILFQEMLVAKKTSLWQLQFLFNHFNWVFLNKVYPHRTTLLCWKTKNLSLIILKDKKSQFVPINLLVEKHLLKYWVGAQRSQSYFMGRRCLFSLGWPLF